MAVAYEALDATMRKFLNQDKNLSISDTADLDMITKSQMNQATMFSRVK